MEILNWYINKVKQTYVALSYEHAEDDENLEFIMQVTNQANPQVSEAISHYMETNSPQIGIEIYNIRNYLSNNFSPIMKDKYMYCEIIYKNNIDKIIYIDKNSNPIAYLARKGANSNTAFQVKIKNMEQLQNMILSTGYYKEHVKEE